jgi:hypothetical protein
VEVFIRRVRTLKEHYGWDAALVRLALVPKLKGTAKIWFNSMDEELFTLDDLFVQLNEQFSAKISVMELHDRMRARMQEKEESTQDYVYKMIALGQNGGIKQSTIVQYILRGLRDVQLKLVAMTSCPVEVTTLMTTVRFYEGIMLSEMQAVTEPQRRQSLVTEQRSISERKVVCYNCFGLGHLSRNSPEQQRRPKCQTCR